MKVVKKRRGQETAKNPTPTRPERPRINIFFFQSTWYIPLRVLSDINIRFTATKNKYKPL